MAEGDMGGPFAAAAGGNMGTDVYATWVELDGDHSPGEDSVVFRGEGGGGGDVADPTLSLCVVGEELDPVRLSDDRLHGGSGKKADRFSSSWQVERRLNAA